MGIAAGITMLASSIFAVAAGVFLPVQQGFVGTVRLEQLVLFALSVLILAAGTGALRKRAYWRVLLAAIGMAVAGMTNSIWA